MYLIVAEVPLLHGLMTRDQKITKISTGSAKLSYKTLLMKQKKAPKRTSHLRNYLLHRRISRNKLLNDGNLPKKTISCFFHRGGNIYSCIAPELLLGVQKNSDMQLSCILYLSEKMRIRRILNIPHRNGSKYDPLPRELFGLCYQLFGTAYKYYLVRYENTTEYVGS